MRTLALAAVSSLLAAPLAFRPARAADSPPAAAQTAEPVVTARIPVKEKRFRMGERVPVEIVVSNPTDRELRFRYIGNWWAFTGKSLSVVKDGRPALVHELSRTGFAAPTLYKTLKPGESAVIPHPGLWIGQPDPAHDAEPYLRNPLPGYYDLRVYLPDAPARALIGSTLEFEVRDR